MKKFFNLQDDVEYANSFVSEFLIFGNFSNSIENPRVRTYNHWTSGSVSGGYYQTLLAKDLIVDGRSDTLDITFGASVSSSYNQTGSNATEKIRIYRKYAQKLLGDPNKFFIINGNDQHELIFINIKRNHFKDSLSQDDGLALEVIASGNVGSKYDQWVWSDWNNVAVENTLGGPRSTLRVLPERIFKAGLTSVLGISSSVGYVYYQQGMAVVAPNLMSVTADNGGSNYWYTSSSVSGNYDDLAYCQNGFSYEDCITGMRQRFVTVYARSKSKIKSTFFNCVAEKEEFNYSSNPTFVNEKGQIKTTILSGSPSPISSSTFITRVGLLGPNDEVLGVGVLSKPVLKTSDLKIEIKVRLDY